MKTLSDSLLSQLSELVAARTALHFPRERRSDLEYKVRSAAKELGFTDPEAFVQGLLSSSPTREQIEVMASHLTIGETFLWREPQVFAALREQILPDLIRAREQGNKSIRIWSAGCASGEEPYSIAIALRSLVFARDDWHITILATDINPRALQRAAAGEYGEWSFRNAPPWLKERYFSRQDNNRFEIVPDIRKMVTFAYLNLAEDTYPSPLNNTNAMDIIFCRNVLMYFGPERARQVGQSLCHSLVEGGWLMVGASELSQVGFPQFSSVDFPGAIVYRKETRQPPPAVASLPPAIPVHEAPSQPPAESTVGPAAPPQHHGSEMAPAAESAAPQEAAYARAAGLYAQGRYAEVVENLERAQSPRCAALAVRALANQGKLAQALSACAMAIAANRLDPGLHYLSATILQEQNREGEAIGALKIALYLDPTLAPAHFALGNLLLRQGQARAAKKSFENALALLSARRPDDVLLESEGLTAGRFRDIVKVAIQTGAGGASI